MISVSYFCIRYKVFQPRGQTQKVEKERDLRANMHLQLLHIALYDRFTFENSCQMRFHYSHCYFSRYTYTDRRKLLRNNRSRVLLAQSLKQENSLLKIDCHCASPIYPSKIRNGMFYSNRYALTKTKALLESHDLYDSCRCKMAKLNACCMYGI
jgi:hypothetical protein